MTEEFARAVKERVRSFVVRRASSLPYHDFEDLCLVGFESAMRAIETDDPTRGPALVDYVVWKGCMAVLNELKRRRLRSRRFEEANDVNVFPDLCPPPSEQAEDHDKAKLLREMMKKLPPLQQEVLKLSISGLSLEKIGLELGFSNFKAHELKHKAIERLRELMG